MRLPHVAAAKLETPPLWPPLLATRGPGATSEGHAHHALHLIAAIDGDVRVRVPGGRWRRAAGVITAPDAPHAVDASGVEVLLVFLDPESDAGASLRATIDGPFRLLTRAECSSLVPDADPIAIMRGDWTRRLAPSRPRMHPRVRKLLAHLRTSPADVSLPSLAQAVDMSPGRLMHAFTASVGIPLRPYLLWLKLQRAAAAIVGGAPLADAAHAAGFSDAAHMTRTFRRMLGMPPSALRSQLIQAGAPPRS